MVVYIFTDGNVKIVSPENIYQGSTVSEITLLTPFPSTTSLSVGFVMPDGTKLTAQPMSYTQTIVDGQSVTAYTYTLPYTVTEQAGEVQMAFAALFSNGTQTSYLAKFEVQESVLPTPPAQPDEDTYQLLLQYIQTAMQNAANAQSAAEAAQTAAESAEDKAAAAETTAEQANATANAANTTAGQANTKADQAVTTANNAAATAAAANQKAIEAKEQASAAQSAAAQAQEDADAAAKSAQAAETSASEASDSAEEAVTAAQGAVTTANEAKTIADGTDGKATEALANSEQAVTTANEAKALAEQAVAGAGTEVYVDNALQARLDFTSDPQTQIDNIERGTTKVGAAGQADKLSAARNLKVDLASGNAQAFDGSANAEDIGVGGVLPIANGGTGASDLGSVKVGEAGSADEATKFSTARNLQVNIASGNAQTFDGSADAEEIGVKGILPEANGGTGATSLANITVGRATADANGNVINTTYAKLTQVVRVDAAQSLTDEEKTRAKDNVVISTGKAAASSISTGWYRVAKLNILSAYSVTIGQSYNYIQPMNIKLALNLGYQKAIITQESGILSGDVLIDRVRVCVGTTIDAFFDVHISNAVFNTTKISIDRLYNSNNAVAIETYEDWEYLGTDDTVTGYNVTQLDMVSGTNTSGTVNQKGSPVLVGSAPTWVTGTSGSLTLPSSGWYYLQASNNSNFGNNFGNSGIVYVDITKSTVWFPLPQNLKPDSSYSIMSSKGTLYARTGSDTSTWYIRYYKLA